ncbi:MAG: integrase [Muricauda sp.]|nr:tyrosine-type recombinase/integrase [Allomuricauda sp.]MAU14438.1 integrase [Allomuricauda sp.]|tara:strand:+ start:34143 stop:35174 length:1032 start_codon:yes stop_codon:yes gene_type:complete
METTTDLAKYLTRFFTEYLVGERGASPHTVRSYGNTFTLVLDYMAKVLGRPADRLVLDHFTRETVLGFLDWVQKDRKCSNSTRNQRLAALHSFFGYMQYEDVKRLAQWQEILSIKVKKQGKRSTVDHLSVEGVKHLLNQVPTDSKAGRRNLALLALLYDSGARVVELIGLTPSSLNLDRPYHVTLLGKGGKKRLVPLQDEQVNLLRSYLRENRLNDPAFNRRPLFANNRGTKLTNSGVSYILKLYVHNARITRPDLIPEKISPHTLRHSKAMHLLRSGVNLVYIRDILGHVSIQTTEVYARADSKQKREALEAAYVDVIPTLASEGSWERDSKLREWLRNFAK